MRKEYVPKHHEVYWDYCVWAFKAQILCDFTIWSQPVYDQFSWTTLTDMPLNQDVNKIIPSLVDFLKVGPDLDPNCLTL